MILVNAAELLPKLQLAPLPTEKPLINRGFSWRYRWDLKQATSVADVLAESQMIALDSDSWPFDLG